MSKARYTHRLKDLGAIVAALALATFVAACGPQDTSSPADEAPADTAAADWTVTPVAPESSEAEAGGAETAVDSELKAQLEKCDNMIAWYELRQQYSDALQEGGPVEAAFSQKEQELRAQNAPYAVNDALELVDFRWEAVPGEADEEPTQFTATWLFHKTGKIEFEPDHNVVLVLRGQPDKSHVEQFTDEQHRSRGRFEFSWRLTPSIDEWNQGEYVLLSRKSYKPIPNVPYRIETYFSEVAKNEEGEWDFVQYYGERLQLRGWYASPDK